MKRVIPVRAAMTEKVLTAGPRTTVAKAAKLMSERGVGSIIITQGKKPVGILTERDLLMKVVSVDLRPSKVLVSKVMSSPVLTVGPETEVAEAARVMIRNRIRRLPVVDRGRLVGIVTASDITAISPELIEVLPERPELPPREEIDESVCEVCGEVTASLHEVNGMWVCENCRDFLGG
ncbi:MAG: CBS domain-containing protein [Candidatus Hodarchaeaceae archaeon]|nr:CBS domain-containing protein [Candidatus Hodarchaeaceae archaeon]